MPSSGAAEENRLLVADELAVALVKNGGRLIKQVPINLKEPIHFQSVAPLGESD
jgi:hypothetical protein